MRKEGTEVAVVGGGLVGSLLATYLVDRGKRVTVYERRPDWRLASRSAGRSINLVLTRRGIRALRRVGLDQEALRLTVPVTGRMMHSVSGELTFQPYGRDDSECNFSISRSGLNEFLVGAAEERGVRFRFCSRLVDCDADRRRLTFADEQGGNRFEVGSECIFGTDGAGSALREALERNGSLESSTELLDHGYKELPIPAAEGGDFRIDGHALHIWPRGAFMLMALPNLDGSFTATLYLPHRGPDGFGELDGPERVLDLFRRHFPDAIPLIPDLVRSFFDNPTGTLGTVRCRPWHDRDRVLLLGDASHAIVPFFGQGMNSGFEDCTVLGELLDAQAADERTQPFAEFYRMRKPNADAIADMALENFVEMRDRVADPTFLLRKNVEHRLEQEMPSEYRSRYSMVMYSHIPFALAREAGRIQQEILDELCRGLTSVSQLDPKRARQIIGARLTPFLQRNRISLDY